MTDSLKKLTGILKDRFGRANMADKYRMEVRNRRRKPRESLRGLHSDIRRLIALAFPSLASITVRLLPATTSSTHWRNRILH